ncbi:MAG: hypothetical protein QNJ35_10935 [Paracoccaceae bacterium]|nr:hypothetical protein [Paracoccaceae bacterium]
MELLIVAAIVLAGSLIESMFSLAFWSGQSGKPKDNAFDAVTDSRYARLTEDPDALTFDTP